MVQLCSPIALFYVTVLAWLLSRFPVSFSQNTPAQLRNRKSTGSGGSKVNEQGEVVMFSDVASVDEPKEELEGLNWESLFLHLRLELLEGIVAYHSGDIVKAKKSMNIARGRYLQLSYTDIY
ncbi:hypothetical protein L2E82_02570 [Cichorium intybus]|uniref:Uncharacterized protein n=1 Tax=Cichorium intybus TaxID=13427 RepID=A0ACB9H371_CICIN|nr:hypothetical protein L2E82_02570 [Cichorium intybus]